MILAMQRDWSEWHRAYDMPGSPLAQRLAAVQGAIGAALSAAPPGPIRVVSMCAGEARDLLGVLRDHPRAGDVTGRLVELDPGLAAIARSNAPAGIDVLVGDAGLAGSYADAVPADLVLACGVFGNITNKDLANTVRSLPMLCAARAIAIWTRHRRPPDLTPAILDWFVDAGFEPVAFSSPAEYVFSVGTQRFVGTPQSLRSDARFFEFVGYNTLSESCADCGFIYAQTREELLAWLRSDLDAFVARFEGIDASRVRLRPDPDTWSPLEYACHVRDVLRVMAERIELAQREFEPTFTPMRRDERVVEDRYNEQDPAVVALEIAKAGDALVGQLQSLDDAGWARRGTYNYPEPALRDVTWITANTVHELYHHRRDLNPWRTCVRNPR
jgi:hypothetical protein